MVRLDGVNLQFTSSGQLVGEASALAHLHMGDIALVDVTDDGDVQLCYACHGVDAVGAESDVQSPGDVRVDPDGDMAFVNSD